MTRALRHVRRQVVESEEGWDVREGRWPAGPGPEAAAMGEERPRGP